MSTPMTASVAAKVRKSCALGEDRRGEAARQPADAGRHLERHAQAHVHQAAARG